MKTFKLASVFALSLAMSTGAMAADSTSAQWEIWTGSFVDVGFHTTGIEGASSIFNINALGAPTRSPSTLSPSIGYIISPYNLQIKLSPSYSLDSRDSSLGSSTKTTAANYRILGGLNFSFGGDTLSGSFFVEAQAGINHVSDGENGASKFAWSAGLGKRFKVTESVNYVPQFQVFSVAQDAPFSAAMYYSLIPVQFSFFL